MGWGEGGGGPPDLVIAPPLLTVIILRAPVDMPHYASTLSKYSFYHFFYCRKIICLLRWFCGFIVSLLSYKIQHRNRQHKVQ